MKLAPIGITTYSRIDHLKKTVDSLKANDLAIESELYIFLDAPRIGDEEKVGLVRDYICKIDGFKSVNIIERKTNDIDQNTKLGIEQLFNEYGKCIFMEDDNVVSKQFLKFMNDGLSFYKNDHQVIALSGFNVPCRYPDEYKFDYYKSIYFNGWGFATWADRGFLDIVNDKNQYNEMMADKALYKKIKDKHPNLIHGLKLNQEGKLNAGDYKIVYHFIKNNLYTIKPIKSLVNNIGHDGSGVHCVANSRFGNNKLNTNEIKFVENLKYNESIDKIFYNYFNQKRNIFYRIMNKISRLIFR